MRGVQRSTAVDAQHLCCLLELLLVSLILLHLIIFIFVFGSGCFYYITKSRDGIGRPGGHQPIPDHTPESKKDWPRNTASDQTLSRR